MAGESDWVLARGFRWGGVHSGLRATEPGRRDVAVAVSDGPAAAAGVFTRNRVCAAPVQVSRGRVPQAAARGVAVCSGNANACTGEQGLADARAMTATLAERLGVGAEAVLVCSTGVIGRPLPVGVVNVGIDLAFVTARTDAEGLNDFAHAILTTDTVIKVATREVPLGGTAARLTGVAKGAAMIGPNMATMLGFVFTDAAVAPADLQAALARACDRSFNCTSVEGHTSTNDTVLALANGRAGGGSLAGADLGRFGGALDDVCQELAVAIAMDAEGATHLVELVVEGCRDDGEARRVAKTVAESALVKTAIFGADPNWGRIVSAAGYSGVEFAERDLSLWLGDTLLYDRGVPVPFDAAAVSGYIKGNRTIVARLAFTLGTGRCRFWTCDMGYDYIRLNADYTT